MTWGEAIRLTQIVRADPSSQLAAAMEGWEHSVTRSEAILMDLWDLEYAKAGPKKRETYKRPWKTVGDVKKLGKTGGRTQAEILEILRGYGHEIPV